MVALLRRLVPCATHRTLTLALALALAPTLTPPLTLPLAQALPLPLPLLLTLPRCATHRHRPLCEVALGTDFWPAVLRALASWDAPPRDALVEGASAALAARVSFPSEQTLASWDAVRLTLTRTLAPNPNPEPTPTPTPTPTPYPYPYPYP